MESVFSKMAAEKCHRSSDRLQNKFGETWDCAQYLLIFWRKFIEKPRATAVIKKNFDVQISVTLDPMGVGVRNSLLFKV